MRFVMLLVAAVMSATSACAAPPAPLVELWRLDCGRFDVKSIGGQPRILSNGCYLIRHGDDYMLWDAGLEDSLVGKPQVSESQTRMVSGAISGSPPELRQLLMVS